MVENERQESNEKSRKKTHHKCTTNDNVYFGFKHEKKGKKQVKIEKLNFLIKSYC